MPSKIIFILLGLTISCQTKLKEKQVYVKVYKNYHYRISINIWNGFYGFSHQYLLDNLNNEQDVSSNSMTLQYISYRQQRNKTNKDIKEFVPADTTKIKISEQTCDTLFELSKRFFKTFEFNNYDNIGQLKPVITDDSHSTIELSFERRTLLARISSISNPTIATPQFDSLLNFIEKHKPPRKN